MDEVSYPYNRMKHGYCPRDEFEMINWGWWYWDAPDVVASIEYCLDDSNWL